MTRPGHERQEAKDQCQAETSPADQDLNQKLDGPRNRLRGRKPRLIRLVIRFRHRSLARWVMIGDFDPSGRLPLDVDATPSGPDGERAENWFKRDRTLR